MSPVPVVERVSELRDAVDAARSQGGSVGLVPTMGYLHEGHQSLVTRSASENDLTVVSIFVNPLQFAEGEDYGTYPRDLDRDLKMCAAAGAGLVFSPSADEMYPQTTLDKRKMTSNWLPVTKLNKNTRVINTVVNIHSNKINYFTVC